MNIMHALLCSTYAFGYQLDGGNFVYFDSWFCRKEMFMVLVLYLLLPLTA